MATTERVEGPTPAGGTYAIAYFLDTEGKPVDKEKAVKGEIVEFDKDGNNIMRTYFQLGTIES